MSPAWRLFVLATIFLSNHMVFCEENQDVDFMSILKCGFDAKPLICARTNAARMLDSWEDGLNAETKKWGEAADREVLISGRQLTDDQEMPSQAAKKLQMAFNELMNIFQKSMTASSGRKHGDDDKSGGGGLSSITITAGDDGKKKKKKEKKKKKPTNIHLHQAQPMQPMMMMQEEEKGVLAEQMVPGNTEGTMIQGLWVDQELIGPAKTRIKRQQDDVEELRALEDGRGKKKKKKKAILKLLLLGAVLKAKLGLLLQLLSTHLQVKFFAIALAGLALNIARFWLDLKKGHQPQKVIYYEHAQHQHHYQHDDDHGYGGGYWSRSFDKNEGPVKVKEEEIYQEDPHSSGYDESNYGPYRRSFEARNIRRRR